MKRLLRACALFAGACALIAGSPLGVCQAQDLDLPRRALAVEGGLVSVQAGLMADPAAPKLPFGKLARPVAYFFVLKNETPSPAWAEVVLKLPGRGAKQDFGALPSGKGVFWRWPSYEVAWDQSIPVQISVYADQGRRKKLAAREMNLFFDSADKDAFNQPSKAKGVKFVSGWREMKEALCHADRTAVTGTLLRDVCLTLWKHESVGHPDCEHPIMGVERLEPASSTLLADQPALLKSRAEELRAGGELVLETWTVKSCDAVTLYEVLLVAAPQGGTDILVKPAGPRSEGGGPPKAEPPPPG